MTWQGKYVLLLAALFLAEIILTLWDFVVEDWIRRPLGGVYPGERIMHAVMGMVYGATLANVVPTMLMWWSRPTRLTLSARPVSEPLRWFMTVMAVGVFLSGVRDLCAAAGLRGSAWPWQPTKTARPWLRQPIICRTLSCCVCLAGIAFHALNADSFWSEPLE